MNGTLQSGMAFDLKIANPTLDSQILTVTREAAAEVLTADPTLTQNGHEGLRELPSATPAVKRSIFPKYPDSFTSAR